MLYLLDSEHPEAPFPPVGEAETEPNGLLAVGGDLSSQRLLNAYRQGIFPWYSPGQPILWWSPDPRTVLFPEKIRISRSLAKTLRNKPFTLSFDRDFESVVAACAAPRNYQQETWITSQMAQAYNALHRFGHAHSVEVWHQGKLAGGLYGVAIGRVFFGESMFSVQRDGSKVALVHLAQHLVDWGYRMIDCQVYSSHLVSLGAEEISRARFCEHLRQWCLQPAGGWKQPQVETPRHRQPPR